MVERGVVETDLMAKNGSPLSPSISKGTRAARDSEPPAG